MSNSLNIDATESTVLEILRRPETFKVPDYQRRYSWEEEQWEDIWHDVLNVPDEETHFLGSMVVIQKNSIQGESKMEVIDGQQRLTTLSIILSIMRDRYHEENSKHAQTIEEEYLHQIDLDGEKLPKLTLSKYDRQDFENILDKRYGELSTSKIKEAQLYFKERLDDLELEEIDELRKKILKSLSVVLIGCENEDAAFRLFETLNDRGMDLSAVDLMKNHLFKISHEASDIDEEEIKETWEKIMREVVYEIDNPDRFFRHYMMSSPIYDIEDSISQYKLYDVFRDALADIRESDELTVSEYIEDMAEQATPYMRLKECEVEGFSGGTDSRINDRLSNLSSVGAVQPRTLLLRVFREYEEPNQILRLIRMLETFELRRRIATYSRGSPLDELYASLCSNAFEVQNPIKEIRSRLSEKMPDDDEFRSNMIASSFSNNDMTKYVLETFESDYYTEGGKQVSDRRDVEIEHIAPRKAFSAKKYSAWTKYLDCDQETFDTYRDRLGNLILLESKYNSSASNNPFESKKRHYESSEFKMVETVIKYDEWRIEQIKKRTEELAEAATEIWSLEA